MKIHSQIFIMLALFIIYSGFASADQQNLNSQLSQFLNTYSQSLTAQGYRSEFKIGNIDPRLQLKTCESAVIFSFKRDPIFQNSVTVKTECNDQHPWKLFIGIKFNIYGKVIAAAAPISRGQLITSSQLKIEEEIINKGRYLAFTNLEEVQGMVAKQSIRTGSVIRPRQLKAPLLIKRGDNVVIVASNPNISVKMMGTALMDGRYGEQISIKNNQSHRIVRAKVTQSGYVSVIM